MPSPLIFSPLSLLAVVGYVCGAAQEDKDEVRLVEEYPNVDKPLRSLILRRITEVKEKR